MQDIAYTAHEMISGMTPNLREGDFVFAGIRGGLVKPGLLDKAIATFREEEGLSVLLPLETAAGYGLPVDQPMRCITLNVYSSLEGVGLTAAVSAALASKGIACNMVAAFHHDHVFVPSGKCGEALRVLAGLQDQARKEQ